jgi:hypothetical protein
MLQRGPPLFLDPASSLTLRQAIELEPDTASTAVYYSNRAAAYTKKEFYAEAIADAEASLPPPLLALPSRSLIEPSSHYCSASGCRLSQECIQLKPEWVKGYSRKATALEIKGEKRTDTPLSLFQQRIRR